MSDHLSVNLVAFLADHCSCGDLDTGITAHEPPRVGRESIEVAYALKQLAQAGVRSST